MKCFATSMRSKVKLCGIMASETYWKSSYVDIDENGCLSHLEDSIDQDSIPDFSHVGYCHGNEDIPHIISPCITITPSMSQDDVNIIQDAIDQISRMPTGCNGYRGVVILTAGTYYIDGTIQIIHDGIVLRGDGEKTILYACGSTNRPLIYAGGVDNLAIGLRAAIQANNRSSADIIDKYVPVGRQYFHVKDASHYSIGDNILIIRECNSVWLDDLQMNRIVPRGGDPSSTKQWEEPFTLKFERKIVNIEEMDLSTCTVTTREAYSITNGGKCWRITTDNPTVMAFDEKYDRTVIKKYQYNGRVYNIGIEDITAISEYKSKFDENHANYMAIFNHVENAWTRNVQAKYFVDGCVSILNGGKNISVLNCSSIEPISEVTGGKRSSFIVNGQQCLVMNCLAVEGRHDFVTGGHVAGPNVFCFNRAERSLSDIGPHMRWATGILYDNITTDGSINVQDRGCMGSGHGWAGANHVLWNCEAKSIVCQNPWLHSLGKNYCIGGRAAKSLGHFKDRLDGIWEGLNSDSELVPSSLYLAQLNDPSRLKV